MGNFFYSAEKSKNHSPFWKLEIDHSFCTPIAFRNQRTQFAYLVANELELNSKSAYKTKRFHKCINMHECISVIIGAF